MKKRMLATLMALALIVSLLPAGVLAVDGEGGVQTFSNGADEGVVISKSLIGDEESGYKISLEAYVTGNVTPPTAQPLDIVLVLDQSGSMEYNFEGNSTSNNASRRQYAMKQAVQRFITSVEQNSGSMHNMAIVTFGSEASSLNTWTQVTDEGANALRSSVSGLPDRPTGATRIDTGMTLAQSLMNTAPGNAEKAEKVVIVFTDGVPTEQANFDTGVANKAIKTAKELKDNNVTIYTVGIFNGANPDELHGEKWDYAVYDDIPCNGQPNSYWGGSFVAGFFGSNDFDGVDVAAGNRFLNYLSSNFKNANEIGVTKNTFNPGDHFGGSGIGYCIDKNFSRDSSNYYLTASDSTGLDSVFQQIAGEITPSVKVDADSVLTDVMSEYFEFDDSVTSSSGVTVTKVKATGSGEKPDWESSGTDITDYVTVDVSGDTITVTGFDYSSDENCVVKDENGNWQGYKLVLSFPIQEKADADWMVGTLNYPTNSRADLSYGDGLKTEVEGSPVLPHTKTLNGTPVTIQVYLDGQLLENPDGYVNLSRHSTHDVFDNSEITRDGSTYTVKFDYDAQGANGGYDCVDVAVDVIKDGVFLQGVKAYENYGSSGTRIVYEDTINGETLPVIDNIDGSNEEGVDCIIYLNTEYSVKYHLDETTLSGAPYNDPSVYIVSEKITETTGDDQKPTDGNSAWVTWKTDESYKTSVTLPVLPTVDDGTVSGWFLGSTQGTLYEYNETYAPSETGDLADGTDDDTFNFYAKVQTSVDYTLTYNAGNVVWPDTEAPEAQTGSSTTGSYTFTVADSPVETAQGGTNYTYRFLGWSTENGGDSSDDVEYEPGANITITEDTTLYGVWERLYMVKYSAGEQEDAFEAEVYYKALNEATPEFSKNYVAGETTYYNATSDQYYVFTGWEPQVAETVTQSVEYKAQWAVKQFSAQFVIDPDDKGGELSCEDGFDVDYEDEYWRHVNYKTKIKVGVDKVPESDQEGYKYFYNGWTAKTTEGTDVSSNILEGTEDHVLFEMPAADVIVTVHYVLKADFNDNDIPDEYEATVTYKVVNGTWEGGSSDPIVETFPLWEKNDNGAWEQISPAPTLGDTVPSGMQPAAGFDADSGSWDTTPTENTTVVDGAIYTFTYSDKTQLTITFDYVDENGEQLTVDDKTASIDYGSTYDYTENTIYVPETITIGEGEDAVQYVYDGLTEDSAPLSVTEGVTENVTITLVYAIDANGDGTPDYKQVFVNFEADENGSVSGSTTQVFTAQDGEDSVTFTPTTVTTTANEDYAFDIWTKDDGTESVNPFTETTAAAGTTITYTAHFTAKDYTVTITPADIVAYTGGDEYAGVVDESGAMIDGTTQLGLPEPGYHLDLSADFAAATGLDSDAADNLADYLTFTYSDAEGNTREWELSYVGVYAYNEDGTPSRYVYSIEPAVVNGKEIPVRLLYKDGNNVVDEDTVLTMSGDTVNATYSMTIEPGELDQKLIKVVYKNGDKTVTANVEIGTGTLTVLSVANDEDTTTAIVDNGDDVPGDTVTAVGTATYYVNESGVEITDKTSVQLLVDSVSNSESFNAELEAHAADVVDRPNANTQSFYLDLVHTTNGNTQVTMGENDSLTIYWPMPTGADPTGEFHIVHYTDMDRLNTVTDIPAGEVLETKVDGEYITFEVSSFSPFVLVYDEKPVEAPSLKVTKYDDVAYNESVERGDVVKYTITVENIGNVDLTNVVVEDTLWEEGTVIYVNGFRRVLTGDSYTIDSIGVGLEAIITYEYTVTRADEREGEIVNEVTVKAGDNVTDSDTEKTPVDDGWTPKPDDDDTVYVPNWLNTTDHYAYIVGYEDGTIRPQNNITRAEVATIFFRLLTDNARERYWSTTNDFSDVAAESWYNNAISTLSNMGIINGYEDGTFKPNAPITRAEFTAIATRFFDYEAEYDGAFNDVSARAWYADYVQAAVDMGLVDGYPDGGFHPDAYITRAEACTIVNRVLHRVPHEDHLLSESVMNTWPDNPKSAWYYEDMQEATNSHDYDWIRDDGETVEDWTKKLPERDWSALETEWATAYSR